MRLGSFKVDGPNGASADVSVIAFPGEAGGLISNLNRWRGQLQLSPLDEDQLPQMIQRTEVETFRPIWSTSRRRRTRQNLHGSLALYSKPRIAPGL